MKPLRKRFAIRRKTGSREIPLKSLQIRSGNWAYSTLFHECLVAKAWGVDLERWDNLKQEAKARMIATYNAENKMRAYEDSLQEKAIERQRIKR